MWGLESHPTAPLLVLRHGDVRPLHVLKLVLGGSDLPEILSGRRGGSDKDLATS